MRIAEKSLDRRGSGRFIDSWLIGARAKGSPNVTHVALGKHTVNGVWKEGVLALPCPLTSLALALESNPNVIELHSTFSKSHLVPTWIHVRAKLALRVRAEGRETLRGPAR